MYPKWRGAGAGAAADRGAPALQQPVPPQEQSDSVDGKALEQAGRRQQMQALQSQQMQALQSQLAASQRRARELESALDEQQDKLETALGSARSRTGLEGQMAELEARLAHQVHVFLHTDARLKDEIKTVADLRELLKHKDEAMQQQAEVEEAREALGEAEGRRKALEEAEEAAGAKREELETEVAGLKEAMAAAEEARGAAVREAEAAREKEARQLQEECELKDAALERLETELDELREALAAAESAGEAEVVAAAAAREAAGARAALELQKQVGEREGKVAGWEQGLEAARAGLQASEEVRRLMEEGVAKEGRIEELQKQIGEREEMVALLEARVARMAMKMEKGEATRSIRGELQALDREREEEVASDASAAVRLRQLQGELVRERAAAAILERALEAAQADLLRQAQELEDMAARSCALEDALRLHDKAPLVFEIERLAASEKQLRALVAQLEDERAQERRASSHCVRCEQGIAAAAGLRAEAAGLRDMCQALQAQRGAANVQQERAQDKHEHDARREAAAGRLPAEAEASRLPIDVSIERVAALETALDRCNQQLSEEQDKYRAAAAQVDRLERLLRCKDGEAVQLTGLTEKLVAVEEEMLDLGALLGQSNDGLAACQVDVRKEEARRRAAEERVYVVEGQLRQLEQEREEERACEQQRRRDFNEHEERWRTSDKRMQVLEAVVKDKDKEARDKGSKLSECERELRNLQDRVASLCRAGDLPGAEDGAAAPERDENAGEGEPAPGSPAPAVTVAPVADDAGVADAVKVGGGELGAASSRGVAADADDAALGAQLREIRHKVAASTLSPVAKKQVALDAAAQTDKALRR